MIGPSGLGAHSSAAPAHVGLFEDRIAHRWISTNEAAREAVQALVHDPSFVSR